MRVSVDTRQFKKDMNNIVEYSLGYLDGVKSGKSVFFKNLGLNMKEVLEKYIDSNARVNPKALHHIYEWSKTGSPDARLYDIDYTVSNLGLSNVPFYDKARIMEQGTSVVIRSNLLVFEEDGQTIFTKNSIVVDNPGGDATTGAFEKTIDSFFTKYFTQAFLRSSGVAQYLENPVLYKNNIASGKKIGRLKGVSVGYKWITNAGLING